MGAAAVVPSLPPEAAKRLTKLAGMFGSAHDGERANAAALADQLVRDHGLTWQDVLNAPFAALPRAAWPRTTTRSATEGAWRQNATRCLSRPWLFTGKELEFLIGVQRRRNPLTPKQSRWLEALAERAGAAP